MYLAPYAPHAPAIPAPRHQNMFLDEKLPRSPSFDEADMSDKPAWIRGRPPLRPRQIAQLETHYHKRLQSLQAVDDLVAAVVDELRAQDRLAQTYIFFMSDNGFHLGEHRLLFGKDTAYEEDIRVPMIVRGPGVPAGRTVTHLGLNNDLAPTWAALAGASVPDFVDGRSLVPLLGASPLPLDAWRQAFLVERHNAERQGFAPALPDPDRDEEEGEVDEPVAQAGLGLAAQWLAVPRQGPSAAGPPIPEIEAIHARGYAYVEYGDGSRELYDLRKDPYELRNLAPTADPGLLRRLSAYLGALRTCAAASCRSAEDAPAPALPAR
jgi:arylsulfatase A-like enzyme